MDVVNPFILKNKIGMVKFVDELCNVELVDPIVVDNAAVNLKDELNCLNHLDGQISDPAHDLAIVHDICEKYQSDLQQQANTSQAARRLVTILKILSKHKQYYINLRRTAQQTANIKLL